ncbi:MAG: DUF2939 domain-containing protein [Deltaproteobacteria bacterium]|nr:DUF2939 domain-containing protein [Deltaproteobacteria bacterium]
MEGQLYKVVFEGEILEGRHLQEVKTALAKMYNAGEDKIERFFSGKRLAIKKDVDYETAMKYVKAFEGAGAVCRIEEIQTPAGLEQPLTLEKDTEKPSEQEDLMVCPKCQFEQAPAEECIRCGIIISKYSARSDAPESYVREKSSGTAPATGNSKILAISIALVVAFLAAGFYYFSGTPRYSLYKMSRAYKNRDSAEFHKYLDIDRIVDHLAKYAVEQALAEMEENQPTGDWGRPGPQFDKELAMMMLPKMLEALKPQIRQQITELIESGNDDRKGSPLLGSTLADIQTEGSIALVTVVNEHTGQEIRFKMAQSPERYWKIVELDEESFQELSES